MMIVLNRKKNQSQFNFSLFLLSFYDDDDDVEEMIFFLDRGVGSILVNVNEKVCCMKKFFSVCVCVMFGYSVCLYMYVYVIIMYPKDNKLFRDYEKRERERVRKKKQLLAA